MTYNAVGIAFETTISEELNLALKKGRLKDVEAKQGTSQQKPMGYCSYEDGPMSALAA